MFENPRRGRQARNFTTNAPKILDLTSSSAQIFSRKLPLGAPDCPYWDIQQRIHKAKVVCIIWRFRGGGVGEGHTPLLSKKLINLLKNIFY